MTDFLFDGPNRLIIEPDGYGDTVFDVERDIYSAWKRWVASGDGASFLNAFTPEGATPIGSTGFATGATLILTNGWKVRAADHEHQVTLVGNLFSDDGVVSVPALTANATIFVQSSVAAQGISTGEGGDPAAIATAVWQRMLEDGLSAEETIRILLAGIAGTTQGIGTANEQYLSRDGSKPRIDADFDGDGNRSAVAVDGS